MVYFCVSVVFEVFTFERTVQFLFALLVQLANPQRQGDICEPQFFHFKTLNCRQIANKSETTRRS